MTFTLKHPFEPESKALYGYDPSRGYGVQVISQLEDVFRDPTTGRTVTVEHDWVRDEYDAFCSGYDLTNPIRGLLIRLLEQGFFVLDDVCEALEIIEENCIDNLPHRLRRIAHIIANLESGLT